MAKPQKPAVDPNSDDAEDTTALGDQSPRFKKLTDDDKLALLVGPEQWLADLPDHALDGAPKNSKIVVVKRANEPGRLAVLATPDGPVPLPEGDPAHKLPEGSRVYVGPEGQYIARLPMEYKYATPAVGGRAAEVIALAVKAVQSPEPKAE